MTTRASNTTLVTRRTRSRFRCAPYGAALAVLALALGGCTLGLEFDDSVDGGTTAADGTTTDGDMPTGDVPPGDTSSPCESVPTLRADVDSAALELASSEEQILSVVAQNQSAIVHVVTNRRWLVVDVPNNNILYDVPFSSQLGSNTQANVVELENHVVMVASGSSHTELGLYDRASEPVFLNPVGATPPEGVLLSSIPSQQQALVGAEQTIGLVEVATGLSETILDMQCPEGRWCAGLPTDRTCLCLTETRDVGFDVLAIGSGVVEAQGLDFAAAIVARSGETQFAPYVLGFDPGSNRFTLSTVATTPDGLPVVLRADQLLDEIAVLAMSDEGFFYLSDGTLFSANLANTSTGFQFVNDEGVADPDPSEPVISSIRSLAVLPPEPGQAEPVLFRVVNDAGGTIEVLTEEGPCAVDIDGSMLSGVTELATAFLVARPDVDRTLYAVTNDDGGLLYSFAVNFPAAP